VEHIQKALETDPEFADANNMLGIVLARAGKLDDGIAHLEKAVANTPDSPEYRFNLGRLLAAHGRFADAIPHFEQAVKLSGGEEPQSLEMLAAMYAEVGRFAQAAEVAHRALDVAVRANNLEMAQRLRPRVAAYEAAAKR
jgi:tetratricopeptide (TPR) repeat protein